MATFVFQISRLRCRKLDEVSISWLHFHLDFFWSVFEGAGGDVVSLSGTHQFKFPHVSYRQIQMKSAKTSHNFTPRITTFLCPVHKQFARGSRGYYGSEQLVPSNIEGRLKHEEIAVDYVLIPTEPHREAWPSQVQLSQSNRRLQHHAATKQAFFLQEIISQGLSYLGEE